MSAELKSKRIQTCRQAADPVLPLWEWIAASAGKLLRDEPLLAALLQRDILGANSLIEAVCRRLQACVASCDMSSQELDLILHSLQASHQKLQSCMAHDLLAIVERDPACSNPLHALLWFKGFHAISLHRFAHELWLDGRHCLAYALQSINSRKCAVDIHPAAQVGKGILLDHATSFVVGETAIIEDDVSILHEVTLGGTGKQSGLRHPIIKSGVLIGAGAKVLGRVIIGEGSKIGAGSVVLHDVESHTTVAGVPAVEICKNNEQNPAQDMNQALD